MMRFLTRNAVRVFAIVLMWGAVQSPEVRTNLTSFASTAASALTDRAAALPEQIEPASHTTATSQRATVERVVDGDTIVVRIKGHSGSVKVRLIGVNTPESTTKTECYGKRAAAYTTAILPPRTAVTLTFDRERTDRYGRTLAYVSTVSGLDVQRSLLQGGFARTMEIKPNTTRAAEFRALATAARAAGLGLWGSCR